MVTIRKQRRLPGCSTDRPQKSGHGAVDGNLRAAGHGATLAPPVAIKLAHCQVKIGFDIAASLRQRLRKLTAKFPLPY